MVSFSARVERHILGLESRLHGGHNGLPNPERNELTKSYIDNKIEKYEYHLREAYKSAPCSGCKNLIRSALVASAIFRQMSKAGKSRADFSEEEIGKIKREVELKYP